ncbi:MAG: hypothetical protein QOJ40_1690 [Verrucomicrobiota bacterium]
MVIRASLPRFGVHALACSPPLFHSARQRGALMMELLVAMALLVGALLPLAYSIVSEKRLARSYYQRAVAMEIVDGEMETLAAGEWAAFPSGSHEYRVRAGAATNLPPGHFILTIETNLVKLEWHPAIRQHGGPIVREVAK